MPFLESTEILRAIAKTSGRFSDAEFREGTHAAARLLFSNESSVFQNLDSLKQSVPQPTEAILMQRKSQAIGANKEANHAGDFEDSFVQPITYVPAQRKFKVSYKLAENNQYGYQEQLNTGFRNAFMDLRDNINTYALAQLAANRNQNGDANTVQLTWDAANFRYTNATGAANVERQASRIKAAMRKNNYGMTQDLIGGQQLILDMTHNAAQGTGNSTNLEYQFNGIRAVEDETIDEATLAAGGYGYVMPEGMVAMTSWNESINRSGRGDVNDNEGLFTTISDPVIPGLVYDVHVHRHLRDNAVTAKTYFQDPTDEYEVTAFYSFAHALINDANTSPIFAFAQL